MKFPVTVKQLIDGKWQARCMGTIVGGVTVQRDSREDVLERAKNEIRYRLEWCP